MGEVTSIRASLHYSNAGRLEMVNTAIRQRKTPKHGHLQAHRSRNRISSTPPLFAGTKGGEFYEGRTILFVTNYHLGPVTVSTTQGKVRTEEHFLRHRSGLLDKVVDLVSLTLAQRRAQERHQKPQRRRSFGR
ncbi:hypothetical protein E6O75_ATG00495 [Venturia nashicola]|uniref:Uncharacterized protein n=1 Tax=Venturia nashicola TaxID=86259 RepID=A0A4Z1PTW7_9PEZI|nr:hypothetical protein E6O75_ATG00495 [Venturia nashicola]